MGFVSRGFQNCIQQLQGHWPNPVCCIAVFLGTCDLCMYVHMCACRYVCVCRSAMAAAVKSSQPVCVLVCARMCMRVCICTRMCVYVLCMSVYVRVGMVDDGSPPQAGNHGAVRFGSVGLRKSRVGICRYGSVSVSRPVRSVSRQTII